MFWEILYLWSVGPIAPCLHGTLLYQVTGPQALHKPRIANEGVQSARFLDRSTCSLVPRQYVKWPSMWIQALTKAETAKDKSGKTKRNPSGTDEEPHVHKVKSEFGILNSFKIQVTLRPSWRHQSCADERTNTTHLLPILFQFHLLGEQFLLEDLIVT